MSDEEKRGLTRRGLFKAAGYTAAAATGITAATTGIYSRTDSGTFAIAAGQIIRNREHLNTDQPVNDEDIEKIAYAYAKAYSSANLGPKYDREGIPARNISLARHQHAAARLLEAHEGNALQLSQPISKDDLTEVMDTLRWQFDKIRGERTRGVPLGGPL